MGIRGGVQKQENPTVRRIASASLSLAILLSGVALTPAANPQGAAAAGCIKFVDSTFDAAGNDNFAASLNGEWVRIKNVCSTRKNLGGWKIHDYGKKHTFRFPAGFRIGPGKTVTLYSGVGTNSGSKRYWMRTYGAVWNNAAPEYAHLRKADGTLMSKWTEY
jgi:hypothetical protein